MFEILAEAVSRLTFNACLDILLTAILIYQAIVLVRGRRAANILAGFGVVLLVYAMAVFLGLTVLRSVLETAAPYTAFALIVMFQSDIRRLFARIGERRWFSFGSRLESREVADEILLAVSHLASHQIGALIVIEREIGLRTFVESGVPVDARVTRDLLLAVFQPGGSLHDGAVIVQGGRLAAAACFLPLTMNPELSRKLGTRHRAAIGVTEEADCLAVVVSEERGTVSIASRGELEMDISLDRLAQRLGGVAAAQRPASALRSAQEVARR
jgi:diadenylate cyclase